ncbi:hypothetical protein PoHVEF18_009592 [Penicillium ochrochloron]
MAVDDLQLNAGAGYYSVASPQVFISRVVSNFPLATFAELRYLDNGPLGNIFTQLGFIDGNDGMLPTTVRDGYLAALMQDERTKIGPRDVWQNVKIPRLESLDATLADSDGWVQMADLAEVESYSSLSGLSIVGVRDIGQATIRFTVETSYVRLSCPSIDRVSSENITYGLSIRCTDCVNWGYNNGNTNTTIGHLRENGFLGPPLPGLSSSQQADPAFASPRHMEFVSATNGDNNTSYLARAICEVYQTLVETRIQCEATECAAVAVRPSTVDHRNSNFTTFDAGSALVLDVITAASTTTADQPMWGSSSSELFINNSNAIPTANGLSWGGRIAKGFDVDLSTVSPQLFAARASILLNTGVQAFLAPTGFAGGLPTNLSLYGPGHIPADGLSLAFQGVQKPPESYDDASAYASKLLNEDNYSFLRRLRQRDRHPIHCRVPAGLTLGHSPRSFVVFPLYHRLDWYLPGLLHVCTGCIRPGDQFDIR